MTGTAATTAPVDAATAWDRLDTLYREQPGNAWIAGCRAAAEWTTGRAGISPITLERTTPEGQPLRWEGHVANMVIMGMRRGDSKFASGAAAWLLWWTGVQPMPATLRT